MRSINFRRLGPFALGLPLACGAAQGGLNDSNGTGNGFFDSDGTGRLTAAQSFVAFPGAGTSGAAQPLSAALAPDTSDDCNPQPSSGGSNAAVQTVCFFSSDNAAVPAATIEQVVEVVGTAEWVHLRLTLNPDFVDNTYFRSYPIQNIDQPAIVMSRSGVATNSAATVTYKVNVAALQAAGIYQNNIQYIAIPAF